MVEVISETVQRFDGLSYYRCGFYFQRKGRRLHRAVWEKYNGKVPDGYHVHHKDGDRSNNSIENLALMEGHDHLSEHMKAPNRVARSRQNIEIAREAASKWHGSEDGREWHSHHGKENWQKREMQTYICTECGKEFQTKHIFGEGQNHFCSNNCKTRYRVKSGVDNVERVCPVCGETFSVNKYSATECCSRECGWKRRWSK